MIIAMTKPEEDSYTSVIFKERTSMGLSLQDQLLKAGVADKKTG